jgi:beta-1,2-mannobiose phosphorylase / 1,2-beta-oligomannan phosphorylase
MKTETELILKPENFKPSFKEWEITGVLNPAAVRLPNKKIMMYVRIAEAAPMHKHGSLRVYRIVSSEDKYKTYYKELKESEIAERGKWGEVYIKDGTCVLPNISHFRKVLINEDGFTIESIEQKPSFSGMPGESDYGVEDPRFTKIDNRYYMTYVGISITQGVSTYLASSYDLEKWDRDGIIFREQNKDVVLFPSKIKGYYVAFNRPESLFTFSKPGIWISYSKDLTFWGKDKILIRPRGKGSWESERVGSGSPPIKTKKGWLFIYHGVKGDGDKMTYSAGAILLDLNNPERIIARSPPKKPLFEPSEEFEKNGYLSNVVFPTAAIPSLDEKSLLVYYGAADKCIAVKKIPFQSIFNHLGV